MGRLIIVSNRLPPPKERTLSAGGLAVALRDAIAGRDTIWFGWSGRTVPGETPATVEQVRAGRLTFALLDLGQRDQRGFYEGFSNGMLWPLLHGRVGLSEFRRDDLAAYKAVNDAYARALRPLVRPDDVIWVHDYHLIPLGAALRREGVGNRIGFFLHVPFPPPGVYEVLPQGDQLARSFAAYDVIGTQTGEDAHNLNEVLRGLGVEARASAYPIGIDPGAFATAARKAEQGPEVRRMIESLGGRALILGVDRLDYSKGLPQRFRGYEQLLKRFPEDRNRVTFLQVAPVSRGEVAQYRALRKELDELAGRIAGEHAEFDWVPIRYLTRAVARNTLAGFHRIARIGLVTPLRDGMNLVAKEYVAAQDPESPGVLVLSRFAGAASEMKGALVVNPYDPDEIAEALHAGLAMPLAERRERWRSMNEAVWRSTAANWGRSFLAALERRDAAAA